MPRRSAGLVVYRTGPTGTLDVLLVHPGGPFWANKDDGAWSIPKGEYAPGDVPLDVARREFEEELGIAAPDGHVVELGEIRQAGGKRVTAFAVEADVDVSETTSNTFEMEWPPRSGKQATFPEVDRVEWFSTDIARTKLNAGQVPLLDSLAKVVGTEP